MLGVVSKMAQLWFRTSILWVELGFRAPEHFRSPMLLWCTMTDLSAGPEVYLWAVWRRIQPGEKKEAEMMGCTGMGSLL